MLNLKHLEYLKTVYDCKSFTRASEILYVSQPTISAAIQSLEKELGVTLAVRDSKNVIFTPEGEELVQQATQILDLCRTAEDSLKEHSEKEQFNLRLGISTFISDPIIPEIFIRFAKEYPNIKFTLPEGVLYEQVKRLANEEIDIAFDALPPKPSREEQDMYHRYPISQAEVYIVLNPEHPLAKLDKLTLPLIADEPILMMSKLSMVYKLLDVGFNEIDKIPNYVFYYDEVLFMLNVIRHSNKYIGIISKPIYQSAIGCEGLTLLPLDPTIKFDIGFFCRKDKYLPKPVKKLIEYVNEIYNK